MAISESQLITWSNQGATVGAQTTHESVRRALENFTPNNSTIEMYLQGSYRNNTNIRGDSDVDLVVQLNSVFQNDTSRLSPQEVYAFKSLYPDATYTWSNLRDDAIRALSYYYGSHSVKPGNKSIKVLTGNSGRLNCDVVVCLQYRKWLRFPSFHEAQFVEGMTFCAINDGRWITNFPKLHYENGVRKNADTSERYKPSIRVAKNLRNYLVTNRLLQEGIAPSYFIECLMYNVPNSKFLPTFRETFLSVFAWLRVSQLSTFTCRNGQVPLFGSGPDQWTEDRARVFIGAVWGAL